MSSMQSEVFEAFRTLNVPEKEAMAAATALSRRDADVASLNTRLSVLVIMVGGLYAVLLPGAWLLLRMAFKSGALG